MFCSYPPNDEGIAEALGELGEMAHWDTVTYFVILFENRRAKF